MKFVNSDTLNLENTAQSLKTQIYQRVTFCPCWKTHFKKHGDDKRIA